MRKINMETWPRHEHFRKFSTWDYPHFSMCANVDLTSFYPFVKQRGFSLNVAIVYLIARTANAIPEFRYRIRPGEVVEHKIVHPASTILLDDNSFTFRTFEYAEDFSVFAKKAVEQIDCTKDHPTLEDSPGQDDLLFMTAIPWVSFTSFMHPLHLHPVDSVPRFAWGKVFWEGEFVKMPLSVQGHHAVMDGLHVGQYYAEYQDLLDQPEIVLGNV